MILCRSWVLSWCVHHWGWSRCSILEVHWNYSSTTHQTGMLPWRFTDVGWLEFLHHKALKPVQLIPPAQPSTLNRVLVSSHSPSLSQKKASHGLSKFSSKLSHYSLLHLLQMHKNTFFFFFPVSSLCITKPPRFYWFKRNNTHGQL